MEVKKMTTILLFALVSCNEKVVTDEQEQRFNACKGATIEMYRKLPVKQMQASERDSAQMMAKDLEQMSLEEFVHKYEIRKEDINNFIESLCLSSEMDASVNELNQKMGNSKLELDTAIQNALHKDSIVKNK